jgi:hypothetical protein
MTVEQANEIIRLAMMLAIEAPRRQGRYSVSATVSWRTMLELRAALTAAGCDLPSLFKVVKDVKAGIRADEQARRGRLDADPYGLGLEDRGPEAMAAARRAKLEGRA